MLLSIVIILTMKKKSLYITNICVIIYYAINMLIHYVTPVCYASSLWRYINTDINFGICCSINWKYGLLKDELISIPINFSIRVPFLCLGMRCHGSVIWIVFIVLKNAFFLEYKFTNLPFLLFIINFLLFLGRAVLYRLHEMCLVYQQSIFFGGWI